MSFLAPFALLLAAGAAVPLLLHLLRRPTGARVDFPAARYLLRAEREHSRSLRIRNLLLMLLRVALVLALALAAARPLVAGLPAGHGATAIAILLDNSLSTTAVSNGTMSFSRLREGARALLARAGARDQLWLVTADGHLRTGDRDALLDQLARITPLDGAGDLSLALRRAAGAVEGSTLDVRMLAIATDGQRSSWLRTRHAGVPVALLVPAQAPPASRGVADVTPTPLRWTPRGVVNVRFVSADSASYRVQLARRTIARGTAAAPGVISLRVSASDRGWLGGRVELPPDDFPADDARSFAVWVGSPPAVTVDPSAGAFASTAIATLVADGRAATGGGVRLASPDAAQRLPALLVPPADPLRLGAANRSLARLGVPWRFDAMERSPATMRRGTLAGVPVSARYRLVNAPGVQRSDTLATVGGEPWAVAGAGWVLIASPLDPAFTELPVRATFLPWLTEILTERLAAPMGESSAPLRAEPGSRVTLPDDVDALESADGTRRIPVRRASPVIAERGTWFLMRSGRPVGALVAEPSPDELDLTRMRDVELARRLGARDVRASRTAADWVRDAFAAGSRASAVTPLLILAALLACAEAIVVRSSRSAA